MACCGNSVIAPNERLGFIFQMNRTIYLLASLGESVNKIRYPRTVEIAIATKRIFVNSLKTLSIIGLYDALVEIRKRSKEKNRWKFAKASVELVKQVTFNIHLLSAMKVINNISSSNLYYYSTQQSSLILQFGMGAVEDVRYIHKHWSSIRTSTINKNKTKNIHLVAMAAGALVSFLSFYLKYYSISPSSSLRRSILGIDIVCSLGLIIDIYYQKRHLSK